MYMIERLVISKCSLLQSPYVCIFPVKSQCLLVQLGHELHPWDLQPAANKTSIWSQEVKIRI